VLAPKPGRDEKILYQDRPALGTKQKHVFLNRKSISFLGEKHSGLAFNHSLSSSGNIKGIVDL